MYHSREGARYSARVARYRLRSCNPSLCEYSPCRLFIDLDLAPAWNSSQGVSAWTLTFDCVRHVLCGRPDRRSCLSCSWRCPYTSDQVRLHKAFLQRFFESHIVCHRPTWRTPIFMFSGIAFAFMILGFFVIEEDEPSTEDDKRVDWIGAALVTGGLVLIVFVLSDVPTAHKGWKSPRELFFSPSFSSRT